MIVIIAIYWIRLFYIQIIDDSYREDAKNNAFRYVTQYPARGLIYDRNEELIVFNDAVYDLMVTPSEIKNLDTAALCTLIDMPIEEARKRLEKAPPKRASVFEKQISKEVYGQFQERLFQFRGFYAQPRTLRKYPRPIAAHVLGYIGEVNDAVIKENPYYKQGDYIGMSGLEKYYETYLRGTKGVKIIMVDVLNREKGSYQNGRYDIPSIAGESLYSTLDIDIQEYGEQLMRNKRGSIVAIEPATGEVLALVSSPGYDPNLLVGRVRGRNYMSLLNDPSKPLFNRALMAQYPPGSIFKIAQAMIALQEGVITPNTGFPCDKSLIGCHNHPSATNVADALKMSCNPYFYQVFRREIMQNKSDNRFIDSRLGYIEWEKHIKDFGFGVRLDIDLPEVKKGLIPSVVYFDKVYGKDQWAFSNLYSLSIGQGEVGVIPLQMANLAAIVANKGYYVTPHLVRSIGERHLQLEEYATKHQTGVDSSYFNIATKGMYGAVYEPGGTAGRARIPNITVCGKTGTAQNPHGKDHAVFIAFAPMENPKIAISVFVENSGFGGSWAAPIASLIMEKYLTDSITRPDLERQMMEAIFAK